MTFVKPFPGTFSYQGTLPSQTMNNINDNFPNVLDKTGDNLTTSPPGGISGRIDVLSGGSIQVQTGGTITYTGGTLTFNNTSGVNVNDSASFVFSNTSSILMGASTSLLTAGTLNITSGGTLGINSGGTMHVKSGATATVDNGGHLALAAGGAIDAASGSNTNFNSGANIIFTGANITMQTTTVVALETGTTLATIGSAFITIQTGGQFRVNSGGTFQVDAGATSKMGDFPVFTVAQTRQLVESPLDGGPGGGTWGFGGQFVFSSGASGGFWVKNLNRTHNGAHLAQLFVNLAVGGTRTLVPATLPSLSVIRYAWTGMFSPQALSTTDPQYFPTPGSGSAYYAGGGQQFMNYVCNQNNIIDNTTYQYVLFINDEAGANSFSGNAYGAITMEFQIIPDLSWNI